MEMSKTVTCFTASQPQYAADEAILIWAPAIDCLIRRHSGSAHPHQWESEVTKWLAVCRLLTSVRCPTLPRDPCRGSCICWGLVTSELHAPSHISHTVFESNRNKQITWYIRCYVIVYRKVMEEERSWTCPGHVVADYEYLPLMTQSRCRTVHTV